jgi:acetoacetyl-CoA synthetase
MEGRILWQPTRQDIQNANLTRYMDWLKTQHGWHFENYDDLWNWSVNDIEIFWKTIWDYFEVINDQKVGDILGGSLSEGALPFGGRWFAETRINYAEHIFRNETDAFPALLFQSERHPLTEISWKTLRKEVTQLAHFLTEKSIKKGDRVVGYLPNIPQATVAFLATMSLGAVWSSASPDFGASAVLERFEQIEPKILIAVNGYAYGGKNFDRTDTIAELQQKIGTLEQIICIDYLENGQLLPNSTDWNDIMARPNPTAPLRFERVEFNEPMWVLYSSGTTGKPKAITHSQGGMLLEHLKYVTFHADVKKGERFFWYTTTGWMMWNFLQASLLAGATAVLYDGSPAFPNIDVLWKMAADAKLQHFGTSAAYISACMKAEIEPSTFDLSALRGIGCTGSPLVSEGFDWIYRHVKSDVWLTSMSGGTDVCTAFVGGCPLVEVRQGEIQRRALGCAMESWADDGTSLPPSIVGEMVVTKPMPCMPIYFWNDLDGKQYFGSYFDAFPNVWRHGDWLRITETNSLQILGRSDATLNRQGIRIGTSEIYRAVESLDFIADALIVNLEWEDGNAVMPLFVVLKPNFLLNDDLKNRINRTLRTTYSPRHVPDLIVEVTEIPYTISGKKLELPVKKILMGKITDVSQLNLGAVRNPKALLAFQDIKI